MCIFSGGLSNFIRKAFRKFCEWRAKRDAARWQEWEEITKTAAREIKLVVRAGRTYQSARRGVKVWLSVWGLAGWSDRRPSWFEEDYRPRKGRILIVSASEGRGSHGDREVLYVERIERSVPDQVYRGWKRHNLRRTKQGKVSTLLPSR